MRRSCGDPAAIMRHAAILRRSCDDLAAIQRRSGGHPAAIQRRSCGDPVAIPAASDGGTIHSGQFRTLCQFVQFRTLSLSLRAYGWVFTMNLQCVSRSDRLKVCFRCRRAVAFLWS
jgi:hypothetical protein